MFKAEGEDELKKKQLMELAIINGTYRDNSKLQQQKINQILIPGNPVGNGGGLRSPSNSIGQPLIISPRLTQNQINQNPAIINGAGHHQFITSTDPTSGLIYATIPTLYSDAAAAFNASQTILDYQSGLDFSQAGKIYLYDYRKNLLCV
jgi:hypothetical protein